MVADEKVILTQNSAYYIRNQLCVAVRARATNALLSSHPAVGRRLVAARINHQQFRILHTPIQLAANERAMFDNDLLTSTLVEVRPWDADASADSLLH